MINVSLKRATIGKVWTSKTGTKGSEKSNPALVKERYLHGKWHPLRQNNIGG